MRAEQIKEDIVGMGDGDFIAFGGQSQRAEGTVILPDSGAHNGMGPENSPGQLPQAPAPVNHDGLHIHARGIYLQAIKNVCHEKRHKNTGPGQALTRDEKPQEQGACQGEHARPGRGPHEQKIGRPENSAVKQN